ncbi:unnamed protein product [Lasius platythorax]|uniref:Uncharacterized protein n=1 Tax=Lasius platythorax TaxID=488582 RepID=A0AAV2N8J9_9HYME
MHEIQKFSSSILRGIRDAVRFEQARSAHVICLVKSMTKEHLRTSSNLSNERAIFEADRGWVCSPLSRNEFLQFLRSDEHLHVAVRPSRSASQSVKKPCPCTRLLSLKKSAFHRLSREEVISVLRGSENIRLARSKTVVKLN